MLSFIRKRAVASLISLIGLVVMVFFLSRLTGDPAALFLGGKRLVGLMVASPLLESAFLKDPTRIEASRPAMTADTITQYIVRIPSSDPKAKRTALRSLAPQHKASQTVRKAVRQPRHGKNATGRRIIRGSALHNDRQRSTTHHNPQHDQSVPSHRIHRHPQR